MSSEPNQPIDANDPIVQSAIERIETAFEMDPGLRRGDELRSLLINRITELLTRNPEKLMAILYRIDVKENAVNEIMSKAFPTEVPIHLADLVIERQLAKARTRAEHRSSRDVAGERE
ncbi:MAG: hypothetical protein FGM33_04565 [Candidatus Kapabacteria bacterium]|nr:hypothetical protein [Candidatus Kapabacteria bacterium]